ncbi:hypothetical protein HDK64DRAFT_309618 [Phyllosticta capitalensis]
MPGTELQLTEEAWGIFVIIFIAVINLLFGSLAWWIVFEDFRIWIFVFLSVGLWTCIVAAIVGSARALYRSVSLNICYWGFVWMLCLTAHQDWKHINSIIKMVDGLPIVPFQDGIHEREVVIIAGIVSLMLFFIKIGAVLISLTVCFSFILSRTLFIYWILPRPHRVPDVVFYLLNALLIVVTSVILRFLC